MVVNMENEIVIMYKSVSESILEGHLKVECGMAMEQISTIVDKCKLFNLKYEVVWSSVQISQAMRLLKFSGDKSDRILNMPIGRSIGVIVKYTDESYVLSLTQDRLFGITREGFISLDDKTTEEELSKTTVFKIYARHIDGMTTSLHFSTGGVVEIKDDDRLTELEIRDTACGDVCGDIRFVFDNCKNLDKVRMYISNNNLLKQLKMNPPTIKGCERLKPWNITIE